jgi:K+-sensing histidine kinase KdpD
MFHDLRGSLVTIAAGLKMLQRKSQGSLGEDSVKFLEETLSKTKILISTTDDFLQSYFSSGECFENKQKCFDLREDIIDPVLYEMRDEILRNHITLINRQDVLPASQTPVQGDRVALKSAFRNLLTNAIKHAGHGGTIRLDMTRQGATWLLRVYNSGPSVPEHLCTTLFSQPALSAAGNNGDNQGLGLGLYLSRKIVNSCGGNIQYLPGQDGSNFILTFPCH